MFVFEKEQYIYDIAGVKIGGTPGESPTVLVGTIFYGGHKIVSDVKNGEFDKNAAEKLINGQDIMSDTTGNPCMVQVVAESSQAMARYMEFVSEVTDAPILIDATDYRVRLAGLEFAEEIGLLDRVIYNSLNISATADEIQALREIQHECAIVLAFNPQDTSVAGKRKVLETGVPPLENGLLSIANDLGITKLLIDTATTTMGAGAGTSASFILISKTIYGHPTGSGVHNAPSSWTWLRKLKKTDRDAFVTCDIASSLIVQTLGADFILYGPISNANRVFPVVAMGDIFAAESAKIEFGIEPLEDHPFKKLL